MTHNYLQSPARTMQSRLRKRGRQGKYSYIHTIRKQVNRNTLKTEASIQLMLTSYTCVAGGRPDD